MTEKEKENFIFHTFKDEYLISGPHFRKKIRKYEVENASELYAKIINYQIKKYGVTLDGKVRGYTPEDLKRMHQTALKRRQDRTRVRDISEQIYKRNSKRKEDK